MKVLINEKEMYIDGYMKSNLDDLKKAIELKWDGLGFYSGYEGDGKTTKAAQDCYYMDPTFCLDRCVFTPKQFIDAITKAESKQAIQFDEAHAAFSAKRWQLQGQQAIISMLTRIRRKNLFITVISPTFFDLSKYLVIHRARYMCNIYAQGLERGRFSFFGREAKHKLYVLGKKTENMRATRPDFFGRFTAFFPLDFEKYDEKKEAAEIEMMSMDHMPSSLDATRREWLKGAIRVLKEQTALNNEEMAQLISGKCKKTISESTIRDIPKDLEANEGQS